MKLGRYVIVDDCGNYVTFSQAVRSDKDSAQRASTALCSSAIGSSEFVYF